MDDMKSISGGAFFLGNFLVVSLSIKKSYISLSIVEAEYIVVVESFTRILQMK